MGVTPSIVSMWERERVKIPEDMEPVSYTHLDVYKRQIWNGYI